LPARRAGRRPGRPVRRRLRVRGRLPGRPRRGGRLARRFRRALLVLARGLHLADQAVRADSQAGYTTLIGLAIRDNVVVGASCGDSLVMTVCSGRTSDLTRAQHKNPPVGSGGGFFVPFEAELIPPGSSS